MSKASPRPPVRRNLKGLAWDSSLSTKAAGAGGNIYFNFDRSRYPTSYLCVQHSEAEVQRDILKALAQAGITAFAFDSGAKAMRSRAGAGGASAGAAGLPDIIGWLPGGRALFIEVKRPGFYGGGAWTGKTKPAGRVSDAQAAFLGHAISAGCAAGVAWSIDDALKIAEVR